MNSPVHEPLPQPPARSLPNRHCSLALLFLCTLIPFIQTARGQDRIFTVTGSAPGELLGDSIACAGPNIFVGAPGTAVSSVSRVGEVRIFDFTSKNLLYFIPEPSFTPAPDALFGASLRMLPDSNSNGIPEILVGAPGDFFSYGPGAVHLYDQGGSQTPIRSFTGQTGDQLGSSISLIVFPGSDTFVDAAFGAPRRAATSGGTGGVDIQDVKNANVLLRIEAAANNDEFGAALSTLQDLDKNGSSDLAVGAPGSYDSKGAVLVYSLAPNNETLIREIIGSGSIRLGASVAAIRDVNGDNEDDLLVGAPGGTGLARLYSGADIVSSNPTPTPLCEITGINTNEHFGTSVASIGDIDSDGLSDFAIGAPGESVSSSGEIRIYHFRPGIGCELVSSVAGNANENLGKYISAEPCGTEQKPPFRMVAGTYDSTNGTDAGSAIVFDVLPTPTPTPTPTPPEPSSAQLTFRISKAGEFKIVRTYDREPGSSCSTNLLGRVVLGKKVYPIETLLSETFSDTDTDERITVFRLLNFPRAKKYSGVIPIINMMVETICRDSSFDSNVFARYMNCGDPEQAAVDIQTWIATLKRGLKTAVPLQTSRTGRKVRFIRLRARRAHS